MNYIHEQPVSVSVPVVCLRRNYKNKNKFKEKVKNQKLKTFTENMIRNSNELKNENNSLVKRVDSLENQQDETKKELKETRKELKETRKELKETRKELDEIKTKLTENIDEQIKMRQIILTLAARVGDDAKVD